MFVGPVFTREAVVAPRRVRHYALRSVYAVALLLLICTAWMLLKETQIIQNVGDMARFGSLLFQLLAPLQLALIMFLAAISAASNIAIEKDRQTLILLLMSRLTNSELVLGKLFASLLNIGVMLLTSLPIFMLIVLFGGTSFEQVGWTFAVTLATAFAAGSLGTLLALWREKTFQTLALVGIAIVFWLGFWEAIGISGMSWRGFTGTQIADATSPLRAVLAASQPKVTESWPTTVLPFLVVAVAIGASMCLVAILKVRKWNPNRELRPQQQDADAKVAIDLFTGKVVKPTEAGTTIERGEPVAAATTAGVAAIDEVLTGRQFVERSEGLRAGHVDDRTRVASQNSRRVWDNPILWREMCTWAYGKKIVFIRIVYWMLAVAVFFALHSLVSSGAATRTSADAGVEIHVTAKPLAPFILLSIVMVNALAVTSITTERDGRALDLLRVTDISPKEFLFGKMAGVLFVAADLILLPIVMCGYLWFHGVITGENFFYLIVGLLTIHVFVAMLGIHSGMLYAASRQAIAVSLGTVFFLFLGVITCMLMMISFTGNAEAQLTPFLACIVGGSIGLYVALGWNLPSPAMVLASALLPMAMFYSITSLLLGSYLAVLLVVCFAYGFATMAMMMPRLNEFLVSSDRAKSGDTE